MANDIEQNYTEQIMALRQERELRKAREEAKTIEDNYRVATEWRDQAAETGDTEAWHENDEWAVELEKQWAALPINNRPPRPRYLTAENAEYVRRCGDLDSPINRAKFQQAILTAEHAGLDLANHEVFVDTINKFVSPGVFQEGRLVEGTAGPLVPPDYQPAPDREEAFQIANNSKYGVKPEEWVRGEHEVAKRNSLGHYRNK